MKKRFRRLVWGLLLSGRAKNWLGRLLGYEIHPSATIAPILVMNVDYLNVGRTARIGPFTVLRDLRSVRLADGARLGQWNWISAAPELWEGRAAGLGAFAIGEASSVTSRHYIDASGGVTVGRFSTVAGVRTAIITHGIDVQDARQVAAACEIGDYCIVSSNSKLVPGSRVPSYSVVGMGAVVASGLTQEGMLYAGVPARAIRKLQTNGAYFTRLEGRVSARPLK